MFPEYFGQFQANVASPRTEPVMVLARAESRRRIPENPGAGRCAKRTLFRVGGRALGYLWLAKRNGALGE